MALILNVSRSHWALYETERRSLPNGVLENLAGLLKNAKSQEEKKIQQPTNKQKDVIQNKLYELLRENEYQLLLTERKINALSKKQTAQTNALQSVAFLSNNVINSKPVNGALLNSITFKATKSDAAKISTALFELELKLELLHLEKNLLTSKLKR